MSRRRAGVSIRFFVAVWLALGMGGGCVLVDDGSDEAERLEQDKQDCYRYCDRIASCRRIIDEELERDIRNCLAACDRVFVPGSYRRPDIIDCADALHCTAFEDCVAGREVEQTGP